MEVRRHSKEECSREAGIRLSQFLASIENRPVLLMLSGGSAFGVLGHVSLPNPSVVTLSVLDERFSTQEEENNFAQLLKTSFFEKYQETVSTIDTRPNNGETLEECAKRFEDEIRNWKKINKDGVIVATLGMGSDGHTAGVFPNNNKQVFGKMFEQEDTIVRGYEVSSDINPHTKRITTTLSFLREWVDFGVVYIIGGEKKEALESALKNAETHNTPASVFNDMKHLLVFTDIS